MANINREYNIHIECMFHVGYITIGLYTCNKKYIGQVSPNYEIISWDYEKEFLRENIFKSSHDSENIFSGKEVHDTAEDLMNDIHMCRNNIQFLITNLKKKYR